MTPSFVEAGVDNNRHRSRRLTGASHASLSVGSRPLGIFRTLVPEQKLLHRNPPTDTSDESSTITARLCDCLGPLGHPGTQNTRMRAESLPPSMRILIVDDHEIMREGLERILADADEQWHTIATGNGYEALEVLGRQAIDLAIVDLAMPGMGGLDLIKRIRAEHPDVAVLVLSMYTQEQYALRAFRAGAKGYVTKDMAGVELVKAVRKVAAGGAYVTPGLAESVILQLHSDTALHRHYKLSDRELEVLRKLVAGDRLTDIGEALHLSVKTVSTHKARILEKLELPNLAALVRYGLEQGLVDDAAGNADASALGA